MRNLNKVLLWTTRTTCNFSCEYCYYSLEKRINGNTKNIDEVDVLIDKIDPIAIFISGEPSTYKQLPDTIKFLKKKNIKVFLSSNGANFTESYTNSILSLNIDGIFITLDGPDATRHNSARQDFDKVVAGIKNIVGYRDKYDPNVYVGIAHVIHSLNFDFTEETVKYAIELRANHFRYQPVAISVESRLHLNHHMLLKMVNNLESLRNKYSKQIDLPSEEYHEAMKNMIINGKFGHKCFAGLYMNYLDENLSLRPCPIRGVARCDEYCDHASLSCLPMIELTRSCFL